MASAQPKPQYITDDQGNRVSVVLPVDEYQELIEDLEDLATVAERREEETVSHADVLAALKADGKL
ncbi:hypothetical protein [Parendozoicomonas haliclonae]|uniref:Antitoxin n=1 Tax=Parendozoicomonas haliclonae TaxID=1960125 RepID=A0A1X7AL09_9GAMM|nr:hypothetical protein [Parendozoicomonas haliclonae]SMA45162.1 hypothetical protein EHSB41UT_01861 [Parendozoicomonas haliclonae]